MTKLNHGRTGRGRALIVFAVPSSSPVPGIGAFDGLDHRAGHFRPFSMTAKHFPIFFAPCTIVARFQYLSPDLNRRYQPHTVTFCTIQLRTSISREGPIRGRRGDRSRFSFNITPHSSVDGMCANYLINGLLCQEIFSDSLVVSWDDRSGHSRQCQCAGNPL